MASTVYGPLISTRDLDAHAALLGPVFGMECIAEDKLDSQAVEKLWGVARRSAKTQLYQTPGTNTGITLIELSPAPNHSIRNPQQGDQHDALKVIDFYVPDFAIAAAKLDDAGFPLKQAEYDMPEGHFREGHLWAADAVVYALIGGPQAFMDKLVQIADRPFSEVMSISSPVSHRNQCIDFYARAFGLEVIYRYGFNNQDFANMLGNLDNLQLTGVNVGSSLRNPFFGLIQYGTQSLTATSLATQRHFEKRGIVGVSLHVDKLDQVIDQCRRFDYSIVAGPDRVQLNPFGNLRSALIQGPHGVLHHALELPR